MVLEKIEQANDIKKLNPQELEILAGEIREFLIEKISKTGGHLASNLGVVELTMALHLAFQLPEDKIIWDAGHQSAPQPAGPTDDRFCQGESLQRAGQPGRFRGVRRPRPLCRDGVDQLRIRFAGRAQRHFGRNQSRTL